MSDEEWEDEAPERIPPGDLADGATAVPIFDGYVIFPNGAQAFCEAIGALALHVTDEGTVWAYNAERHTWVDTHEVPVSAVPPPVTALGSNRKQ